MEFPIELNVQRRKIRLPKGQFNFNVFPRLKVSKSDLSLLHSKNLTDDLTKKTGGHLSRTTLGMLYSSL